MRKVFSAPFLTLLIGLFLIANQLTFAQPKPVVSQSRVCGDSYHEEIRPVKVFKDKFKLTFDIDSSYAGEEVYREHFKFTETFSEFSSIVQIADRIAIQVHVTRITVGGQKFYGKRLLFFRKEDNCWKEDYTTNDWKLFNLGDASYSTQHATDDPDDRLGFEGLIVVE